MNYGAIKKWDIADGPGVRVSLFVSGCRHHCKGCFQPETWDFDYGRKYTKETEKEILEAAGKSYISGVTLLGGEPFEPENQKELAELITSLKNRYPEKSIWCYTGYVFERDLMPGGTVYTEYTQKMLKGIDVIVDGEFIAEEKDLTLEFRGSKNQRILHIHEAGRELPEQRNNSQKTEGKEGMKE